MKIKIVHAHLEAPLELSPEAVKLFIIENPSEFYKTIVEINSQFNGGEGDFVLVRDGVQTAFQQCGEFVRDVFSMDFCDKRIISLLYKRLDSIQTLKFPEKLANVQKALGELFDDLFSEFPFALEYDEAELSDLLKVGGVKPQKNFDSLIEKIICDVNLLIALKNIDLLVFVNLKSVLTDNELRLLYEHCKREKVSLLLIESSVIRPLNEFESATIITRDLCEIHMGDPNF